MTEKERIIDISDKLQEASTQVSILRNIAWPGEVEEEFFRNNAEKLPVVEYKVYDSKPVLDQIKAIRKLLPKNEIGDWASRIADKIENSALLLASRGTYDFHTHSVALFGKPSDPLQNGISNTLDLATHFDKMFEGVNHLDLGAPPDACILASTLAEQMKVAVTEMFGDMAPEVVLDPNLASNALAGRRRISIRPGACFSDKDIEQLIHHEAYVHVATSLNGYLQKNVKILSAGHAGTTKTQEGIAIFAEFITGTTDLDRLQRLADRVLAIQMAIEGASFIDIYRFYLERTESKAQSFQNAKRVFRGGVLSGKAPFTKDIVYLEGLINVHVFLKTAMTLGKMDHLDLLFAGKLDLTDLPVVKQLWEMGLIEKPRFLPPWMKDKRFLMSHLSYSSFLNRIDLDHSRTYNDAILK